MSSKRVSHIFKILFQTGDVNIFVILFLVDMFYKKAPFLTKTTSAVKSETQFNREAIEKELGRVLKEKSIIGIIPGSNYTDNGNGN